MPHGMAAARSPNPISAPRLGSRCRIGAAVIPLTHRAWMRISLINFLMMSQIRHRRTTVHPRALRQAQGTRMCRLSTATALRQPQTTRAGSLNQLKPGRASPRQDRNRGLTDPHRSSRPAAATARACSLHRASGAARRAAAAAPAPRRVVRSARSRQLATAADCTSQLPSARRRHSR